MVTTLPLKQYLTHPVTWGYLDNLYLYITFGLPGVFEGNRFPGAVNGSLWSLPAEFAMYLLLALAGFIRSPRVAWAFIAVGLMALSALWAARTDDVLVFYRTDLRQVVLCGVFFWVGAVYQRYGVERFFSLANVCLAMFIWLASTRWPTAFMIVSWFVLPFVTLAFGLASSRWLAHLTHYDYSYGIYIYAFPIQQVLSMVWPVMNVWLHVALAVLLTTVCAAVSWHWVESQALKLKPRQRRALRLSGEAGSSRPAS
jgi:peptidoglycan/LPS O-acetylase OafA/YrhL